MGFPTCARNVLRLFLIAALTFVIHPIAAGADPAPATTSVSTASVRGKVLLPPEEPLAKDAAITVYVRFPRPRQWQAPIAPDGSFLIEQLPPDAKGTILFPRLPEHLLQVRLTQPSASLKAELDQLRFDSLPAGVHEGIEVRARPWAVLSGNVVDRNGSLISDAKLSAEPMGYGVEVDPSGQYRVQVPPDTQIWLRIESDPQYENLRTEPVKVAEGEELERDVEVRHRLRRPHEQDLMGVVVDGAGKPVAGATVSLGNQSVCPLELTAPGPDALAPTWEGGVRFPARLKSDQEGRFVFDRLYPGKTDLWAESRDGQWGWVREIDTNARGVRIVVEPQRKPRFDGVVLDADGKTVAGARLALFSGDDYRPVQLAEAPSDSAGRFAVEGAAPADEHRHLRLICTGPKGQIAWRTLPLTAGKDLPIQFKPQAELDGKVTDGQGQPLTGATVRAYAVEDPDYGRLTFDGALAPAASSGSDGRFLLATLPAGGMASLRVTHASAGPKMIPEARLEGRQTLEDTELPADISLDGTVRSTATSQPVAGATVAIRSLFRDVAQTTADAQGRYHMGGLGEEELSGQTYLEVRATADGDPPKLEGVTRLEGQLAAGDALREVDVALATSFSAQYEQWKRQPGTPIASKCRVAVLDDADAIYRGKDRYDDTIGLHDSGGKLLWQAKDLNVCQSIGSSHALAANPSDGATIVCENAGGRLLKFDAAGKLLWQQPDVNAGAVAIDPRNGDVWALISDESISGNGLAVFSSGDGKERRRWDHLGGFDIVYCRHDDCFWIVGQRLLKIGRDGQVLAESDQSFAWVALSLAVDERDGSVWVAEGEHPQVPGSARRLWVFAPDGKLRKQVATKAYLVASDPDRGVIWAAHDQGITQLDRDGNVVRQIPLRAFSMVVEPDTGCLWVASPDGLYRVDSNGNLLWSQAMPGNTQKWLCIVPAAHP